MTGGREGNEPLGSCRHLAKVLLNITNEGPLGGHHWRALRTTTVVQRRLRRRVKLNNPTRSRSGARHGWHRQAVAWYDGANPPRAADQDQRRSLLRSFRRAALYRRAGAPRIALALPPVARSGPRDRSDRSDRPCRLAVRAYGHRRVTGIAARDREGPVTRPVSRMRVVRMIGGVEHEMTGRTSNPATA